jgi:hypothetical protein
MKKNSLLALTLLFAFLSQGQQLLTVASGTSLTIKNGTVFKVDSLTLTPSADYSISNNSLTKSTTVVNSTSTPYISRVYRFGSNTDVFNGAVQINYTDGAELNGIAENSLTLNVHNGTNWIALPATTRDAAENLVLTNGVSAVLNELTLASLSAPLPLAWLSFTATKQNKTALLKWATTQEQNTRNFTLQHSGNGTSWTAINTLPAVGASNDSNYYNYVHTSPLTGINYYRVLQTDLDNRSSYSAIRTLKFTTNDEPFLLIGNPVTNSVLSVQVNMAAVFALYTADGKMLWQQPLNAGTITIDVSRFSKGIYFLKSNNSTQKVVLQ